MANLLLPQFAYPEVWEVRANPPYLSKAGPTSGGPEFIARFSQAQLLAAVEVERERCAAIVTSAGHEHIAAQIRQAKGIAAWDVDEALRAVYRAPG